MPVGGRDNANAPRFAIALGLARSEQLGRRQPEVATALRRVDGDAGLEAPSCSSLPRFVIISRCCDKGSLMYVSARKPCPSWTLTAQQQQSSMWLQTINGPGTGLMGGPMQTTARRASLPVLCKGDRRAEYCPQCHQPQLELIKRQAIVGHNRPERTYKSKTLQP